MDLSDPCKRSPLDKNEQRLHFPLLTFGRGPLDVGIGHQAGVHSRQVSGNPFMLVWDARYRPFMTVSNCWLGAAACGEN